MTRLQSRSAAICCSTAPTGSWWRARRASARRSTTRRCSSWWRGTAVAELGGRIPVIAGTGTNDTRHSIELTRAARGAGVDGILAVTPYYNKPPAEGLRRHFTAIAEAAELPVILYNIPARVVIDLPPSLLAQIAARRAQRRRGQAGEPRPRSAARAARAGARSGGLRGQRRLAAADGRAAPGRSAASASPPISRACKMHAVVDRWQSGDHDGRAGDLYATSAPPVRSTQRHDQSHPGEGGARTRRLPGGRAAPAAGRGDRRRGRGRARCARAARLAPTLA